MSNLALVRRTVASLALFAASAFAQTSVIQGDVKGVDGRAAKGAEVRIQPTRGQLAPIIAKTDAGGRFVANNIAAGAYNILAVANGVSSPVQAVRVQASKPLIIAFDLRQQAGGKTAAKGKKKTKFVWMPDQTGSHLGGHWVEVDEEASGVPSAQHVNSANGNAVRDLQSREANVREGGSGR
jgi:hypothetical protein